MSRIVSASGSAEANTDHRAEGKTTELKQKIALRKLFFSLSLSLSLSLPISLSTFPHHPIALLYNFPPLSPQFSHFLSNFIFSLIIFGFYLL